MVFAIAVDEPRSAVEAFVKQFRLTFPVLLGNTPLKNQYNIAGSHISPFPRDFIIGMNGKIAYASDKFDPEAMNVVIQDQLGLSVVPKPRAGKNLTRFHFLSIFPNPWLEASNPGRVTNIQVLYQLESGDDVSLRVYDLCGRERRILNTGSIPAGTHVAFWDGRDYTGKMLPTGIYFLRLQGTREVRTAKMVIVR